MKDNSFKLTKWKTALWTLEDNVERSQTDGPNVAVECGLRLAFDESNIVLWWLRLPLRNHDMPWLKYSPNRHILRLESNGRKCKTKKILFQIFYSLLLYKWNFKNGKCFVTLFVNAVGGAGGWVAGTVGWVKSGQHTPIWLLLK